MSLLIVDAPVKIGLIQIDEADQTELRPFYHSAPTGILTISIQDIKFRLPSGVYSYFSTTLNVDGRMGDLNACIARLDVVSSLLTCLIGRAFAYAKVFELEVSLSDGQTPARVNTHRIGRPEDEGPFIHPANWKLASSLCNCVSATSPELRQRVLLSIDFLTKGLELRDDGFFEYWTSLEVLCGGSDLFVIGFKKAMDGSDHMMWMKDSGLSMCGGCGMI